MTGTYPHRHTTISLIMNYMMAWMTQVSEQLRSGVHHRTKEEIADELACIRECQKDPKHFAPLYTRYHDDIFLFIHKRTNDLELTADLTSRTFLQCIRHISKFRYQGVPFASWLYKIALNEVNGYFRKESKKERPVSIDDAQVGLLMQEIDHSEIAIDPYVMIPVLLEQLNEAEVQFIELRFFENKSFKEMGYLLGISAVNAKIKTYRILSKLQQLSKNIKYND